MSEHYKNGVCLLWSCCYAMVMLQFKLCLLEQHKCSPIIICDYVVTCGTWQGLGSAVLWTLLLYYLSFYLGKIVFILLRSLSDCPFSNFTNLINLLKYLLILIIWAVEFSFFQMLLHLKNERLKWTVHTYNQSAEISRLLCFPLMFFSRLLSFLYLFLIKLVSFLSW